MAKGNSNICYFILGIIGLFFIVLGFYAFFIQAKRTLQETVSISHLPESNMQTLVNTLPGTTVIFTGILEENNQAADIGGLIIYIKEIWSISYNDSEGSEGWEGSWKRLDVFVPVNSIAIQGGSVLITKGPNLTIDQTLHEFKIDVPRKGREVNGIKEGSLRHRGFKSGDQITVVGIKDSQVIIAERIFGGNRADLERYLTYMVSGLRTVGIIFCLVGVALIGTAAFFIYHLRQA